MSLSQWQKVFLDCIQEQENDFVQRAKPIKKLSIEKCAEIYRLGYMTRLTESLGESFEATWWVLGDEDFFKSAREYIRQMPSQSYDLSAYGESFVDFLKKHQDEIPFIYELALFDWVFKKMFHAPEQKSQENLIEVLSENPNARLQLSSPSQLWQSKFSVYPIWRLRGQDISQLKNIEWQKNEYLLLQKNSEGVQVSVLSELEYRLLREFERPSTLEEAISSFQKKYDELAPELAHGCFIQFGTYQVLQPENT